MFVPVPYLKKSLTPEMSTNVESREFYEYGTVIVSALSAESVSELDV